MFGFKKVAMPKPGEALPGRATPIRTPPRISSITAH